MVRVKSFENPVINVYTLQYVFFSNSMEQEQVHKVL